MDILGFPPQTKNPDKKTKQWGIDYAKAAWAQWSEGGSCWGTGIFYNSNGQYDKYKLYAIGKNPVDQYKTLMGVDQQSQSTWLNLDWQNRPVWVKLRNIGIARMMEREWGITCTPIDSLSKTDVDVYFAEAKAKIAMRKLAEQAANPELLNHPMLQVQQGEPLDFEELEMRMEFGEQFNRSKDAELAIALGLYENDYTSVRRELYEDLWDIGVAGTKEWLGEDNKPKFRRVNVSNIVVNFCRQKNFSDMVYCGEAIDVSLFDLQSSGDFTDKEMQEIADLSANKWGNPALLTRNWNTFRGVDKFHARVLDLEFISVNKYTYEYGSDKRGNPKTSQAKYGKNGEKYVSRDVQVVYKIKWVVGTNYAYDFGIKEDQKRSVNSKKKGYTSLSYRFYAPNFYEMRATGMTEMLKPLCDDYMMTSLRIQNFKANMVPSGWVIDTDALENVALGQGGANMTPAEVIKMFRESGIVLWRSKDIVGERQNYKPVEPVMNSVWQELAALYEALRFTLNEMQNICGLNDITDGSTPNPKTLIGVANMAQMSTNNALYPFISGENYLFKCLAEDILCRTQQGIRKGGITGYAPALNTNTLRFIEVSPALPLHEFGVMVEERTSQEQKDLILNLSANDIANGFLDTADVMYILNVYNVKQAIQMIAYRVKKNKEQAQQNQMALNQQTIQGQQQSAMISSQTKQQELQLEYSLKAQLVELEKQWEYRIREMEMEGKVHANQVTAEAKVGSTVIQAQAKSQSEPAAI